MRNENVRKLTLCGMLTALLCVCAAVTIPIGPTPITLQTLVVAVIGLALGWRHGVPAVAAYLLLGVAGLPVFAGMRGGAGVLAGPTGGYLTGFIPAVFVIGFAREKLGRRKFAAPLALAAGEAVLFACGCAQLAAVGHLSPMAAFKAGLLPFLAPELLKMTGALVAARYLCERVPLSGGAH